MRVSDVSRILFSCFGFRCALTVLMSATLRTACQAALLRKRRLSGFLSSRLVRTRKLLIRSLCWGLCCPVWDPVSGRHNLCPRKNNATFQVFHRQGRKADKV